MSVYSRNHCGEFDLGYREDRDSGSRSPITGYCSLCERECDSRNLGADGEPASDCCDKPVSHTPIYYDLITTSVDEHGLLVSELHDNYSTVREAEACGEVLKLNQHVLLYRVEKSFYQVCL